MLGKLLCLLIWTLTVQQELLCLFLSSWKCDWWQKQKLQTVEMMRQLCALKELQWLSVSHCPGFNILF